MKNMDTAGVAPKTIKESIREGHKNPTKAARVIAKILLRDIWSQVHQHEQKDLHGMDPLERVAVVALRAEGQQRGIAKKAQLDEFVPTIELLIKAHSGKRIDAIISPQLKEMVARAVLERLGAIQEQQGNHELAHFIHNAPNPVHFLENPVRVALADYGVTHANPRGDTYDDGSSVWTGHRATAKFEKGQHPPTNIYLRVTGGNQKVTTLVEGDSIHTGSMNDLIVIDGKNINIQEPPHISQKGRVSPTKSFLTKRNTIGKISGIQHLPIANFTGWTAYKISGDKGTLSAAINHTPGYESLSFGTTNGQLYSIETTAICVDGGRIIVLGKKGEKITYNPKIKRVVGVRKNPESGESSEAFYFIRGNGEKQKLIFNNEQPTIKNITKGEEHFFKKTK